MIESVQIRHRGAVDFDSHYDNLCAMQDSCPLPAVKAHLQQNVLDINGDRVRVTDWQPILNTLKINKSLEFVGIRSYYTPPNDENEKKAIIEKRKMPSIRSKEITYRLCKALKECLSVTPALSCLELQGLPLRERDLTTLIKGLAKNSTLSHVSFEFCRIGDNGLDILCKGIKNSTTVNSINFTGCSLTAKGADSLAKVIKHQAMKRHNEAWRDSLRYRRPDLDRMSGIRRITINNNPMLGDQGATYLAEALKDDLWLKALDMQGCGISTTGAKSLLDVLKYNTTVVVLDVRRNPLIDREVVHAIMEQLMINSNGQDTEYKWLKAEEPLDPSRSKLSAKKRRTKTLNSSFGRKTTIKVSANTSRRRTKSTGNVNVARKMNPISSEEIKSGPGRPWRTAARANRFRGFPPEHVPGISNLYENSEELNLSTQDQSSIIITKEEDEDTMRELEKLKLDDSALITEVNNIKDLRVELIQTKRRMHQEQVARSRADKRIVELTLDNKKLKDECFRLKHDKGGGCLDDDSVLEEIEASFKQFHQFLDLLRESGLGQLITMAGLDKKDTPFGRHMSSTALNGNSSFRSSFISSSPPKVAPKPLKPTSRLNAYYGDISSSKPVGEGQLGGFGSSLEKPDKFTAKLIESFRDPAMQSGYGDESFERPGVKKTDDLYERILRETSGAFNSNVSVNSNERPDGKGDKSGTKSQIKPASVMDDERETEKENIMMDLSELTSQLPMSRSQNSEEDRSLRDSFYKDMSEDERPTPQPRPRKISESDDKKSGGIKVGKVEPMIASKKDMSERESRSRMSDYNYSMDSFEQSYVSERGERIVLEGDLDLGFGNSPSPPAEVIESEEDF
ncbi:centrosomal protein of 78 kDa-like [Mytilus trossulus]|uniref:centrosomal protein of 78 kDa-like n=1 Tax=Mytilus trossulus TaxID=6551 RepID=UPI003003F749